MRFKERPNITFIIDGICDDGQLHYTVMDDNELLCGRTVNPDFVEPVPKDNRYTEGYIEDKYGC